MSNTLDTVTVWREYKTDSNTVSCDDVDVLVYNKDNFVYFIFAILIASYNSFLFFISDQTAVTELSDKINLSKSL